MARRSGRRGGAFVIVALVAVAAGVAPPPAAQADPLLTCPETPVIHQVCSVGTAAPNLVADGVEAAAGEVFDQATAWVVAGAVSVVGSIGATIDEGTRPDPSASWFDPSYRLMVAVGGAFLLPLVLIAALWSLLRHDVGGLIRIVTVKLPVAAMGMIVATWVVNLLVGITDNLSAFVGSTIGGSGELFAFGIVRLMEGQLMAGNVAFAGFLPFLVALVIALLALLLWIELVVRQAAVLVSTLFLPLGFAGLVWESTAHWLRKLAEGLLAFILAKFVITAVVAVGANAIAAGGDQPAALILGAGILVVAVFTPYVLLSLIPLATVAVAEGLSRRPLQAGSSTMSSLYWGQALMGSGSSATSPGGLVGSGPGDGGEGSPQAGLPAQRSPSEGLAAASTAAVATVPMEVAAGGTQLAGRASDAGQAVATVSSPPVPTRSAPQGGDGG